MYNKSYYQLVREGVITQEEEIHDFIDYWANTDSINKTITLREYLGLSPSMFNLYLQDLKLFFYTLKTHR